MRFLFIDHGGKYFCRRDAAKHPGNEYGQQSNAPVTGLSFNTKDTLKSCRNLGARWNYPSRFGTTKETAPVSRCSKIADKAL
jgi:hypothetical protein